MSLPLAKISIDKQRTHPLPVLHIHNALEDVKGII